ncbi:MAG TPA: hypothetical protein P5160_03190 [Candidatus Omnitrophota bacterium]|nr:hypothetical protein [Candidatus Omnitrophota bacterium]
MRRTILLSLLLTVFCVGCASIQIPGYLQDKKPSVRQFYGGFERTSQAVRRALAELGWEVEDEVLPEVYEVSPRQGVQQEVLMISVIRQTSFFIGTRYARMNVYIRSNGEVSEVELRYMKVSTLFFSKKRSYGDENFSRRFFELIERNF